MTAVEIQNYGNNSYMIRQPFDFTNRTGKIDFDVDAVSASIQAAYVQVALTDDPIPATTFREVENFEAGPVPRNGLMLKWTESCGSNSNLITLGNTLLYNNYLGTTLTPTFTVSGAGCLKTRQGSLNHFEIQISQQHVDIFGSDYSTDNGLTYPNFHKIYSANMSLPFSRAYVHIAARNHATEKYGYGPDFVFHWDNIGFDGPVISGLQSYEIPDNTTLSTYNGHTIMNLGYILRDGTNGIPAGMYSPGSLLPPFQFQNVSVGGALGARLSLNAFFNTIAHTALPTWGLSFRFNSGTWRNRLLTPQEVQAINTPGSAGNLSLVMDVPVADLRAGMNTLEMLPLNAPMDYPPAVANIDLVLSMTPGTFAPARPTNLRLGI